MAANEFTNPLDANSGLVAGNGTGTAIAPNTPGVPSAPGTAMIPGNAAALSPSNALTTLSNRLPAPAAHLLERFNTLPQMYKIAAMVGLAAIIALIVVAILWSRKEEIPYHILFSGIAETDTAQVMEALEKNNIPYRIDPRTGVLTVPADEVHATRIKLAGMGLPKTPPVGGFETLDAQSPFGTSQFMENVRYQHALEGELAKSILTLGSVQSARVHLALPRPSVFVRDREKPSASVVLQLYPSRYLDRNQVEAIVHLVASSIPQLEPKQVSVVDQSGELLTRQDSITREMDLTRAQFEHVRRVEDSYVKRIEHILTPLTGENGIRAQVTVDVDFSDTEQTREVYNPDQPSLRSEQTVEEQSQGPREMGIPGALSNQPPAAGTVPETLNNGGPPPEAGKGVTAIRSQDMGLITNKRHATRNYEVDRTISHTRNPIGQTRRISAAVVVDDGFRPGIYPPQKGPRSPEEMERIRTLVREAIGYDAQRGDAISVVNLSFMSNIEKEIVVDRTPWWRQSWAIELFRQGMASLLILVLILGVLRPVVRHLIGEEEPEEEPEEEIAEGTEIATIEKQDAEEQEEDNEEGQEDEDDDEDDDDTRELKPAGEGAEESEDQPLGLPHKSDDEFAFTLPKNALPEALSLKSPAGEQQPDEQLAPLPDKEKEEIPAWLIGKQYDYEDSLAHIRKLIKEEPKMVSEIIKDWILSDNPGAKGHLS